MSAGVDITDVNADTRSPRTARAVGVSAAFAAVAGFVLWPPRAVYWTAAAAAVGTVATLALVALAALALGAAFGSATGVDGRAFAAGTAVAYVAGMAAIEVVVSPDGPAHLVLYGGIAACLVAGVGAARVRSLISVRPLGRV